MNVINTDDLIPYLPLEDWNFKRYGKTFKVSVANENKYLSNFRKSISSIYWNSKVNDLVTKSFSDIAFLRDDLYKLDTSNDGKVNIGNSYYSKITKAREKMTNLETELEKYKLAKFCKLKVSYNSIIDSFYVETNYCPAYLMQNIANLASEKGLQEGFPPTGYDTAGKYAKAKAYFISAFFTGLTHPHMQPTYYIISSRM